MVKCSPSPHNWKTDDCTSLIERERLRNVQNEKRLYKACKILFLVLKYANVLIAVVVVIKAKCISYLIRVALAVHTSPRMETYFRR